VANTEVHGDDFSSEDEKVSPCDETHANSNGSKTHDPLCKHSLFRINVSRSMSPETREEKNAIPKWQLHDSKRRAKVVCSLKQGMRKMQFTRAKAIVGKH